MATAPPAQKIGHIATFEVEINRPAAIKNAAFSIELCDQIVPGCLFFQPDIGIAAVRNDVELKMIQCTLHLNVFVDRFQAVQRPAYWLMVDGKNNGCSGKWCGLQLCAGVAL